MRWYLRFGLSYRDLEELPAEQDIKGDHVTLYRWVQRFTPVLIDAARPQCAASRPTAAPATVIRGHAFIQNLHRGHYDLGTPGPHLTIAVAIDEQTGAI